MRPPKRPCTLKIEYVARIRRANDTAGESRNDGRQQARDKRDGTHGRRADDQAIGTYPRR